MASRAGSTRRVGFGSTTAWDRMRWRGWSVLGWRRLVISVVLVGALSCVVRVLVVPAVSTAAGSGLATETFMTVGESTFVVPAGDSSISVTATGAQGAAGFESCGGFGAAVTATLPVTAGETLYVEVGGVGSNGGGGGGGEYGGGGASDLRALPEADGLVPTDSRLLVAGGGGGGGDGIELNMKGCGGNAGSAPAGGAGAFGIGAAVQAEARRAGRRVTRVATVQPHRLAVWASAVWVAASPATTVAGVAGASTAVAAGERPTRVLAPVGAPVRALSSLLRPMRRSRPHPQPNGEVAVTYNVGPPAATVLSPSGGGTYMPGQVVSTSFSCTETQDGPGITWCFGSTGHSGAAGANTGALETGTLGNHTYRHEFRRPNRDGLDRIHGDPETNAGTDARAHADAVAPVDLAQQLPRLHPRQDIGPQRPRRRPNQLPRQPSRTDHIRRVPPPGETQMLKKGRALLAADICRPVHARRCCGR